LRQELRQKRSRPILDRIWHWATVQVGLPRSDFGKAVRYMLERWTGLTRFVDDPCIPLDNNAAERALRGPVVGRKNHYGSRSLRGTEVAAVFYTLCETARVVGVDPGAYLLRALYRAIDQPGTVTLPEDLIPSSTTI
jgi:transposase